MGRRPRPFRPQQPKKGPAPLGGALCYVSPSFSLSLSLYIYIYMIICVYIYIYMIHVYIHIYIYIYIICIYVYTCHIIWLVLCCSSFIPCYAILLLWDSSVMLYDVIALSFYAMSYYVIAPSYTCVYIYIYICIYIYIHNCDLGPAPLAGW